MSWNYPRVLLGILTVIISLPIFAAAPFSHHELQILHQYMYDNFASQQNVFTKTDEKRTIISQPGAILASPSNKGPGFSQDYQFHWTRDAGVAMWEVLQEHARATLRKENISDFVTTLHNYINFERSAQQQLSNPGEQTLGQPKFNIDGTIWEGVWARPQNDGPALRARALCETGRIDMAWMREVTPLVKLDLDYIASEWQQPNFDLWEEVKDKDHFFTKMMQERGLTCGANLFYFSDHTTSQRYTNAARDIKSTLAKHWNEKLGYLTETVDQLNFKGGGLDSAVLLAVLYGNELSLAQYVPEFSVLDDRVMSTVAALRDAFAYEYPINRAHPQEVPLIGRYPGDKYDGNLFQQGNPWILTTVAMAEYYYSLAYVYQQSHIPIEITRHNKHFFEQLHLPVTIGKKYKYGTNMLNDIIVAWIDEGDRYLQRIKRYGICGPDYNCLHFAEQIDAKTGQPTSAKDLTWGYVNILRAMAIREKLGISKGETT